jgi:F0F1-type ATP synthase assembly protein I
MKTEAASLGIEMAVAVFLGAFGGIWLERNVTHVAPWTSLAGLAIGLGAAVVAVVRTVRNFHAREAARRRDEERRP